MPAIAVAPFTLKDVVFTVGTDDYQAHVSSVAFTPASSTVQWQGLTPTATYTDTTTATWTCTIAYAQDWVTVNSLAQYLLTNAGQKKTVVFKPKGTTTGSPIFTVDLFIAPGQIGGDVNTVATATVTMGCAGAPVKSTAP